MFKQSQIHIGVVLALAGALALPVLAQQTQRVEITGSSIKRADAETSLPVTTITKAEIERTGATTAQELVNLIPSNFGGLVIANNIGSTGNASQAGLRGLPPAYTLILLNGRRVTNYAFSNVAVTDLNSIPLSAVERVEVLRDGASAIYGADAVAGVINFILRKDYQGLEGGIYGEHVQHGGGATKNISLTGGFGDLATQGYNVLVTAFAEKVDELKAKDRPFGASAVVPELGINKASPRNGIPNLNFTDTLGNGYGTKGNGVGPLVNPFRFNGCNNAEFSLVIRDSLTCGTDYVKYIDLVPEQEHKNILGRGTLQLNADNQAYAEAMYVRNNLTSIYSPAPYTLNMTYPTTGRFYPATITLPKGMTVKAGFKYPDGHLAAQNEQLAADTVVTPTGPISGTWRTVAGGGRTDLTEDETSRFLVGLKGTMLGWDYDTAFVATRNWGVITFGPGQFSYAKLTPLVAAGDINVFGSQDATSLAALNGALLTGPEQSATSTSKEIDFHASRDLMQLPAGPLGFAFGGSYRKETLDQVSYPVLASGDQVGGAGPIPSVSGDRKVLGLFAEAAVPIVQSLDGTIAVRYDDYKNGFGTSFSNWSPKATLRFQPMKELVARGSYGKGYRAPALFQNLRPFTVGNNTNGNYSDPIRCPGGVPINNTVDSSTECNVQLNASLDAGNKDLKPEKSSQYSLGLAFSPTPNFSGSIDYWDISINDVILRKSEIQVLSDPVTYKNFIYRYNPAAFPGGYDNTPGNGTTVVAGSQDPTWPIAYIYLPYDNQGKFKAAGFDFSAQFRQKLESAGTFAINYDSTLYTKHGYQYPNTDFVSDLGKYKDFGPTPKYRHMLTFSLTGQEWFGSLTNNYTHSYEDFTNPDEVNGTTYPATRTVGTYSLWDGQLGWRGVKGLDVVFGVKNIFDTDPPRSRTEQNFQTGYDATFTNPLGRTYYLRLKYKFF